MLSKGIKIGFLFIALAVNAFAQKPLKVTVLDNNRQPVPLAYINEYDPANHKLLLSMQTDDDGITMLNAVYPCDIEVVALGFETIKVSYQAAPVIPEVKLFITKKYSPLDEVVVTGLSEPVKLKDALSSYQVIPRSLIQAQGAVTLDDVLKTQLNISLSNDNILGAGIGMQGMGGDKVKILIDGMPLNGREAGNINISQVNMNNVDRIEIVQGPMSVVYGTDALGGVINVITKKDNKPLALRAGGYYESIGKYNADVSLAFKAGSRNQFTVGAGRNFFQGWGYLDTPMTFQSDTLNDVKRSFQFKPIEQRLANLAYIYTAPSQFKLQLFSDYLKETVTNKGPIEVWDPYNSYAFDEYYKTTRSMNRLAMNGKLGKTGKWQSQSGYMLYYRTKNKFRKNMVSLNEIPTAGKGDQDTSLFNDVSTRGSYNNNFRKLNYTVGYDVNMQFAHSTRINGTNKTMHDYAAYANVNMPLVKDKLVLQLGARAAYNTGYKPPVIPSADLLFTPIKKLQVRASYSQGYRAPSLKEMYLSFIDINHYIIGNPDLKPEESKHAQLSASYQLYQKEADYIQFMVTGYYNDVKNGIVLLALHPEDTTSIDYQYGNITRQSNNITTVQADGQWRKFHYRIGYSNKYTFEQKGSYKAFNAGEATAMLQYAWKKPKINFSLFYKYNAAQPFLQKGIDGTAIYNGRISAYSLCDLSAEKRFVNNKVQIVAGIKNVFNVVRPQTSGVSAVSSAHGGSEAGSFLPRSVFTSVRVSLD